MDLVQRLKTKGFIDVNPAWYRACLIGPLLAYLSGTESFLIGQSTVFEVIAKEPKCH